MEKCKRCLKQLELVHFEKDGKIYLNCHPCREKMKLYRQQNKDEAQIQQQKQYKLENKERTQKMNLFYRMTKDLKPEEVKILKEQFQKEHGIENKVKNKPSAHRKLHTFQEGIEGKECSVPNCGWHSLQEYNRSSKDWDGLRKTCMKCMQEYRKNNRAKMNEYHKKKFKEDQNFSLRQKIKSRIHTALHCSQIKKNKKTEEILGCTIDEFKKHLQDQFTENMSWDNCGFDSQKQIGWHIDHKIPCASWDLMDPQQLLLCFHYKNCCGSIKWT